MNDARRVRRYQLDGVTFLVRNSNALLADEMGLGKTAQAILATRSVLKQPGSDRALVIAPASLLGNWEREIETWAPDLPSRRVTGPQRDRAAVLSLPIALLVTSYEQIRADARALATARPFEVVILDEAQRIKNRASDTFLACSIVPRRRSWALTGTPLENSPADLVSVFQFLSPGVLRDGMQPSEVHTAVQDLFLRRTKEQVLPELPSIITQDLVLELAGEQRSAYDDLWQSRRSAARRHGVPVPASQLLALITQLKQLCNFDPDSGQSVKLEALQTILESFDRPEDKILIFSQYVETLRWLSRELGAFPHDLFHGGLGMAERDEVIARFTFDDGPRALLMSYGAGAVGLNIQAATVVLLFDRWWNPAVEDQAINRAHRMGRATTLQVVRLLVRDSIEERIVLLLHQKRDLIHSFVATAPNAVVDHEDRDALRAVLDLAVEDIG